MTSLAHGLPTAGWGQPTGGVTKMVSALPRVLLLWQQRAEARAPLAELGSDRLDDLGISRADALRESRKPFWMP